VVEWLKLAALCLTAIDAAGPTATGRLSLKRTFTALARA
jgi:hypothetical protein